MAGPLAGLRVLELAGLAPSPHATMVLADLGADVVRVARPDAAPPPVPGEHLVRGKATIELDLKSASGKAALVRLAGRADVFVEANRPGVMERLGLGPAELLAANPRLVYARMTGWGQSGPLATTAGHDITYLALTGVLGAIGHAGERPVPPLNLVADFGGGSMFLLVGVLSALYERDRSGRGQVIDAAMVDGVGVLASMVWSLRSAGAWSDERGTNLLDSGAPFYDTYRCADGGYVAVGALEPQFYVALLAGLELTDVPPRDDRSRWPELRELFRRTFAARSRDEWAAVFEGTDACVTPVLGLAEAPDHPHLAARGSFVEGMPAPAPRFSRSVVDAPSSHVESELDTVEERWAP